MYAGALPMSEDRSSFQKNAYIGLLTVFLGGFLASGLLGPLALALVSLIVAAAVSVWYFWPGLRRLRVRSPIHAPSVPRPTELSTNEAVQRRGLKSLLVFLAQRGDNLATAPPYIWKRWEGAVTDVLQEAFGAEAVDAVIRAGSPRKQVEVLRQLIRDLDALEVRPDFNPLDFANIGV